MKLCRNCHWCVTHADDKTMEFARCLAPQNMVIDLVSGGNRAREGMTYCVSHRGVSAGWQTDSCGIAGRWYSEVDPAEADEYALARHDAHHSDEPSLSVEQRNAGDPCMIRRPI